MIERLIVVGGRQRELRDEATSERMLRAGRSASDDGEPYFTTERHPARHHGSETRHGHVLGPVLHTGRRAVLAAMGPDRRLIDRVRTDDPCLPAGRPC